MRAFTAADVVRRCGVRWGLLLALASGLGPTPLAADADATPPLGALDGRRFAGTFGPDEGSGGRPDTLTFSQGRFWSANCVPCGFKPALYWVRHEGDAIHFRGEMHSHDRGRFTYRGVIRDGVLNARVRWQKDRWYWSIDRMMRFEGQRVDGAVNDSVAAVTRRAVQAGLVPEPDAYCPL